MSKFPNGFGMAQYPEKVKKPKIIANKIVFKKKLGLQVGNGSKGGAYFNGRGDKELIHAKGYVAPVYNPELRVHPSPTSRYR